MEVLLNELTAFRKQLAALENRNIALKTQLAHILQYHFDRSLLDRLEYFHNVFLQQDTRFEALRGELALQQAWLSEKDMNAINYENIRTHQVHIRAKLKSMETDLKQLLTIFLNYVQDHFPAVPTSVL
ncbi:hypothetical protein [Chitinophaga rhizophila]|uniref:Uncharacterized protein n=1 Tax=Chitinophaga rhizophila TaxID=2866212 RepID=A0ABS7GIP6_9BACT|nr:hypothetical protein [Chitinophaga rhizophila]MBW8687559.1 hypothetical protein [Chitinophaga rhizophila]